MMNQGGRKKDDTSEAQRREPTNEKQTNAIVRISEQLAVSTIETRSLGAWVFFAAAAGLTVYGLYLLFAASYLRLIATW